ncbi:MAG: 50S ribosomal protein L24 [Spirochaetia bacterium]
MGTNKKEYKIKKNDEVKVIAGKDKGKTGRVLKVDRINGRVVIEGINMAKKTMKKKKQNDKGGIAEVEAPVHISNVMLMGKSGKPSRVGYRFEGKGENRKKVRFVKKSGETV